MFNTRPFVLNKVSILVLMDIFSQSRGIKLNISYLTERSTERKIIVIPLLVLTLVVSFSSGKCSFNSGKRLGSSTSITANLLISPVTIPTFTSENLLHQSKISSMFAFLYW